MESPMHYVSYDHRKKWLGGFIYLVLMVYLALCASVWPAQLAAQSREPLLMPKAKELYQRIITLPGALLRRGPGQEAPLTEKTLPVFSILYVFAQQQVDGTKWLEVGQQLRGPADGWLSADKTQDWTMMLIMQYAPSGQRNRALFFENRADLLDIVEAPDPQQLIARLIREADAGNPTDPPLLSIEPKEESGAVTFAAKPYLMPIVGFHRAEFDDGTASTLVEIASVSAEPPKTASSDTSAHTIKKLKIGVVFVIDTTISMGPYIERAIQTISSIYAALEREGLLEQTSFGLVGFRNNMDKEPQRSGLEYVVRVYQDLDPNAPVSTILSNMRQIREAKVSTHSFDEDAIAGLYTAINELNWEPYGARLILFVTDAGTLSGNDPKARFRGVDILNIRENANRKNTVIFPIHLHTDLAARLNNIEPARKQYQELARTGDESVLKYIAVRGASIEDFEHRMGELERAVLGAVRAFSVNQTVERPALTAVPDPASTNMGTLIVNELFSAQQRYIGAVRGTQAPRFFRAWASDKDLTNPKRNALQVSVFLTRNQLNELALGLRRIIDQSKTASLSGESFFVLLQSLAAATSTDPVRFGSRFASIAESRLLPAYLTLLPYQSKILKMSNDDWRALGPTGQQNLIGELEYKLRVYQDIYEATKNWRNLGAGDPGQEVYPMPLEYLP